LTKIIIDYIIYFKWGKNVMKKKERLGVSLIVLVITIIVIIILAGAVIFSLSTNNPISQASKAVYLSDVRNFQSELDLYKTKQYVDKLGVYNPSLLQADDASITYNGVVTTSQTIHDLIPLLGSNPKYNGQFQIINGELIFGGYDTTKQDWTREIGLDVVIIGEPKITMIPPAVTIVEPGTNIVYTVKFSSNAALTTFNLLGNVVVTDDAGVTLASQPVITIGTITGTTADAVREVNITVATNTLVNGIYKLKIKPGVVTNANNVTTTLDILSVVGFEVIDILPPVNPTMLAAPTAWTNGNVTVTITYAADVAAKEYSTNGTTWNAYTVPIVVSTNATTIYARGRDLAGNQSGVSTITVANIDKTVPIVTASNGGATTSSVTITAVASDTGGSALNASSYQYSKDNGTTWTTATSATTYTYNALATGTYQCKVKAADNAGNSTISNAVAITVVGVGTITMLPSSSTLTNGNVTVTITYPAEIVTKQYSTNGTTWNTYTVPIVVSTNGTTVYAKGADAGGNQASQVSITVNNINIAPTINVTGPTAGNTFTTSLTLQGTATDTNIGDIISVKYNIDGGTTQAVTGTLTATGSAQTFTSTSVNLIGLAGGAHTLNVWSEDSLAVKSPTTSIGFTKQVLYTYNKYNSNLTTQYIDGSWTYFQSSDATGVSGPAGSSYTFSTSTGYALAGTIDPVNLRFDFYTSIYILSGLTVYRYDRGSYLYAWPANGWGDYSFTAYTKTCTSGQVYTQGSLVQSGIQAVNGTYPDNGRHSDGFWYVKGGAI
jgi:hypothetical protein